MLIAVEATLAFCSLLIAPNELSPPFITPTPTTTTITTTIGQCKADSNCVSSNYREPPNRYVSPLKVVNEPEIAFQRAVRDIKNYQQQQQQQQQQQISILEIVPKEYYIHFTVPGTAPSSVDDIELSFSNNNNDNIVNLKCQARVTLPPPPFCIQKNCINGNMDQRKRIENIATNVLGLPSIDNERMREDGAAKWTPIFFNSDKVPGFYDE